MAAFDTLLIGYYGMQNTGDDMLMAAAAEGARRRYHSQHIAATGASGSEALQQLQLSAVQAKKQRFKGQDRLLKYWAAARSEHIIIGGGSVFHTAKDIAQKTHYLKLATSNQHCAAGVGLGPFNDVAAEKACATFLNACAFTGLRDKTSLDIARSIAPNANTALTFDLAPSMISQPAFQHALMPERDNAIGVALCPVERLTGDENAEHVRNQILADALIQHHRETGAEIRLIDFNGHPTLGDQQVHRDLCARLGETPCKIIPYNPNPYEAVMEISKLSMIVAMRLHAAVFAYLSNTPCISLNYHRKCENWCRDIQQSTDFAIDSRHVDKDSLSTAIATIHRGDYVPPSLPLADAEKMALSNWTH